MSTRLPRFLSELLSKSVIFIVSRFSKMAPCPQQMSNRYLLGERKFSGSFSRILLYCRKDATLREVLTTLRNTAPQTPEYRHPLARYSFRAIYADSANRGHYSQKDLGVVYSRDILGDPGNLQSPAPRLLEDEETPREPTDREKEERTLEVLLDDEETPREPTN